MHMRLTLRPSQSLRHELRLSLAQRYTLEFRLAQIRLDLIGAVRGVSYRPEAICPQCGHRLNLGEILRGFTTNPTDITTGCPKCQTRFESKMVCRDDFSSVEIPFFCAVQVLDQLSDLLRYTPEELRRQRPAVYHSALFHHGTLRAAFERAGVVYRLDEVTEWSEKIIPFLGRLPDTEIAECIGQPVRIVRLKRKQLNIPPFRKRDALREL